MLITKIESCLVILVLCLGTFFGANVRAEAVFPSNVVATWYHAPIPQGVESSRSFAFANSIDADGSTQFDTYCRNPDAGYLSPFPTSHFAGLVYDSLALFSSATLTIGSQFSDGGHFDSAPSLYLLKNGSDPNKTDPSTSPAYTLVSNAALSGAWSSQGDTVSFDLTGLTTNERTGYGFAIYGPASGSRSFISVSGLSASVSAVPEPSTYAMALAGIACGGFSMWRRRK